jgi:hypothetical protein
VAADESIEQQSSCQKEPNHLAEIYTMNDREKVAVRPNSGRFEKYDERMIQTRDRARRRFRRIHNQKKGQILELLLPKH